MTVAVKIIDPIHRIFIKSIFNEEIEGVLKISMLTITGMALRAVVRVSPSPIRLDDDDRYMLFEFPISDTTESLQNKFLMINNEGEKIVNSTLRAEFNNYFMMYILTAVRNGKKQREAIYDFIYDHEMVDIANYANVLKKFQRVKLENVCRIYSLLSKRYKSMERRFGNVVRHKKLQGKRVQKTDKFDGNFK